MQTRYDELEEMRDAIIDRYPFEDPDLRCAAVDYEEALIGQLLRHPDQCAALQKEKIMEHKNGN